MGLPEGPQTSPHDAALTSLTRKGCSLWMSTRSRTQAAPSSPWRLRSRTGGLGRRRARRLQEHLEAAGLRPVQVVIEDELAGAEHG